MMPMITSPLEEWTVFLNTLDQHLGGIGDQVICQCGCIVSEALLCEKNQISRKDLHALAPGSTISCIKCCKNTSLVLPIMPLRHIHDECHKKRRELDRRLLQGKLGFVGVGSGTAAEESNEGQERPISGANSNTSIETASNTDLFNPNATNIDLSMLDTPVMPVKLGFLQLISSLASSLAQKSSTGATNETLARTNTNISGSGTYMGPNSAGTAPISIGAAGLANASNYNNPTESMMTSTTTTMSTASAATASAATSSMSSSPNYSFFERRSSSIHAPVDEEIREFNFSKSFPVYRKQFIHTTPQARLSLFNRSANMSRVSYATCIAPDCTKFAMVGKRKWYVYSIPDDYNDPPVLVHTGNTGEDANFFITMSNSLVVLASSVTGNLSVYDISLGYKLVYSHSSNLAVHCLAISNQHTIATGIIGRDKQNNNQPLIVLHYLGMANSSSSASTSISNSGPTSSSSSSNLNSLSSEFDTMSINDQNIGPHQQQSASEAESSGTGGGMLEPTVITVPSPYRDPIVTLSFSEDDCFLACSTYSESRFIVISIINPLEPRLLLKSSRRAVFDPEYEGITSIRFFPNNSKYMAITSTAEASPPIIMDNKIENMGLKSATASTSITSNTYYSSTATTSASGSSSLASGPQANRPAIIMKVDKVGTQIHKVEVSPRGDAMAFLDKSGLVYMMSCPGLINDFRRITIVADVSSAPSGFRQAASMRFTPSGQVLMLVDRRGFLHIEDFGAGLPHQSYMGKCRILA